MKRIAYFFYYLKELDKAKLKKFISFVSAATGKSAFSIWKDIVVSSLRYNISILEYFNFNFYKITAAEKNNFAGTGFMYEYQLHMNPKDKRFVLEDKVIFLKEYAPYVKHAFVSIDNIDNDSNSVAAVLNNPSGKLVLKDSKGQCGNGVKVITTNGLNNEALKKALTESGNDYAEEFVTQHKELMRMSPSGLNTVRIITQLNKNDEVDLLGCRLRITINSSVDNLAAGNIAAPIDEATGKVTGPGVYSDITKQDEYKHPVTGTEIPGFQVPYWNEAVAMVKAAALANKGNRSIGWDVAITQNGPELIEGNHDWCKLLWQLPVKKGLKPLLEKYLNKEL